jgi:hypothetical protein
MNLPLDPNSNWSKKFETLDHKQLIKLENKID